MADETEDLALQLQNPIASLISVPIKLDWDTGSGPQDADRYNMIMQPVIPFSLNDKWNVISRTIVPVYTDIESPVAGGTDLSGFGDILQSFFFSPKAPTSNGWIWGAGPALLLPSASKDALGAKFSVGPTAVLLKQQQAWTFGLLSNHLWSVTDNDDRADVSNTLLQPFLSYTTTKSTTFNINTESVYNWNAKQWTVPVNLSVSQLVKIGKQPVSLLVGYRHYADAPVNGPDWGLRFQVTLLFPK